MQDPTNTPQVNSFAPPAPDANATPEAEAPVAPVDNSLAQVIDRVNKGDNILVALSKNPNVDELTSAIALTMYLDKYGKHATAIFSGKTPNAIKFLRPEETLFENTDSLQDFIIALNKEKADHLRYKLEGDFVKVYITPYKAKIDEKDLEFSYGEYNVDLVIALNVPTRDDLDAALSEHGRIMHDATAININAGPPQNFGDLEWGDPEASSVSEMVFHLIEQLDKNEKLLDASMANALLAGLISATDRFSNVRTSSEAMSIASRLLQSGADQQMVSASISGGERKVQDETSVAAERSTVEGDSISINHKEQVADAAPVEASPSTQSVDLSSTLDDLMSAPASKPEEMPDPMPLAQPEPSINEVSAPEAEPVVEPGHITEPDTISTPVTEPHTPTETPDFSVAPPTMPGAETEVPASVEMSAPIEAPTPTETPAPIEAPASIETPAPVEPPVEAPTPVEDDFPQMPQASSSLDALLPPPPPPPAAPNAVFPEPSAPSANFNPQIPEPSVPTPSVEPAQFNAPAAQPMPTEPEDVPGISSFQIPDTGQDESIFGTPNTN